MYISKLILNNFKGFKGEHIFTFSKGINYFVGDNNCGKSTLFKAVEFIKTTNKMGKEFYVTQGENEVTVVLELCGNISEILDSVKDGEKYKKYIEKRDNIEHLTLMRSSESVDVGKKHLDITKVRTLDPENNIYDNPTGFDSAIGSLFETQFIWADSNTDDIVDFGTTKICGKLLNIATKSFYQTDEWKNFEKAHKNAFKDNDKSFISYIKPLEKELTKIMNEQHGEIEVEFDFSLPEAQSFIKSGKILLKENNIKTSSNEKGTGTQRALAFALIQIYSKNSALISDEDKKSKPILFFIDEPETYLHPRAQIKIIDALRKISKDSQIFITTHSPYLLKTYEKIDDKLYILVKENGSNKKIESKIEVLFGLASPTWGEINYYAYKIPTVEFHNELYGYIQAKATIEDNKYYSEDNFDLYLKDKGCNNMMVWKKVKKDNTLSQCTRTTQTFIRNSIHHPENTNNDPYSIEDLMNSIETLISVTKDLNGNKI